jgi:signal transduction histidine kinase
MLQANMSHECSNPLNSLSLRRALYDQISGPLNEKQTEYVGDNIGIFQNTAGTYREVLDLAR